MLRTADDELTNAHLLMHALALTGCEVPRVCYLPTALGDAEAAVASQRQRFADGFPDAELSVLTPSRSPASPTCAITCCPSTCCSSRAAAS